MTKNEDYEDPLCGLLRPCSLGSPRLTEAYGRVALVFEDVGKSKRPAAVPTESLTVHWLLAPQQTL